LCKKLLDPLETSEINWYFNGKKIKQSQKYTLIKQKEISTLVINRINENDSGCYLIQMKGRSYTHMANFNIESRNKLTVIFEIGNSLELI
jgi:hypothetical protein